MDLEEDRVPAFAEGDGLGSVDFGVSWGGQCGEGGDEGEEGKAAASEAGEGGCGGTKHGSWRSFHALLKREASKVARRSRSGSRAVGRDLRWASEST